MIVTPTHKKGNKLDLANYPYLEYLAKFLDLYRYQELRSIVKDSPVTTRLDFVLMEEQWKKELYVAVHVNFVDFDTMWRKAL